MTIEKIPQIEGAYAIVRDRFEDVRGSFQELYNFDKMVAAETPLAVKQANQSISFFGTLRGLHIQANNPQGKLISVAYGQIFDVMVDLRPNSSTYKKVFKITLTDKPVSLYVPPGCAHGFFTKSQVAIVHYLCSTTYDKDSDGGIHWQDPELNIEWPFDPMSFTPLVSLKDSTLPTMAQYLSQR